MPAKVALIEVLSFDLSDVDASQTARIGFSLAVEGTFADASQPNFALQLLDTNDGEGLIAQVGWRADQTSGLTESTADPSFFRIFDRYESRGAFTSFGTEDFNGYLDLVGGQVHEYRLFMRLSVDSKADFSNTARFSFDPEVAYDSASGVFGTAAVIPLPGAAPLLAAAMALLAGLGLLRRRG